MAWWTVGRVPVMVGSLLRPLQNGLVQSYALMMVLGLAALVLAVLSCGPARSRALPSRATFGVIRCRRCFP